MAAIRFRAFDDAAPALAELRRLGLSLVCVSNWDVSLPEVLGRCGLDGALDGVVTSAEAGARKPDPAIFQPALRLAGCSAPRPSTWATRRRRTSRGPAAGHPGAADRPRGGRRTSTPSMPSGTISNRERFRPRSTEPRYAGLVPRRGAMLIDLLIAWIVLAIAANVLVPGRRSATTPHPTTRRGSA